MKFVIILFSITILIQNMQGSHVPTSNSTQLLSFDSNEKIRWIQRITILEQRVSTAENHFPQVSNRIHTLNKHFLCFEKTYTEELQTLKTQVHNLTEEQKKMFFIIRGLICANFQLQEEIKHIKDQILFAAEFFDLESLKKQH